jgi:hypothetical protein
MNGVKFSARVLALVLAASFISGCVIAYPRRERVVWYRGWHHEPPVVVLR